MGNSTIDYFCRNFPTMKKWALSIIAANLILGCASTAKIDAMKPEPDDASPLVYEHVPSYINLPVSIKLKDIEGQANKYTTGLIYEDSKITDDDMEVRVWKQAPIKIDNANGKIRTVLPLKVHVKFRIGTDRLGVDMYSIREFNLNGTITLLSQMTLNNWKLNTQTTLQSLEWNESPSTTVMGKQVPITYVINPAIKLFKSKIEKTIDESIQKSVDFKPQVLDALAQLSSPYQMSETYQTWLRIVPSELYTTSSVLKNDAISLQMGLKCDIETIIGQKPTSKFDRDKMVLKPVTKMPNQITANIVAVSTYADASRIIAKNFAGQEFSSGSRKVTVQQVNLWHKAGKIVIALDLSGSLNGTIYLTGFPQYNEQTQEIYFDQLDYAIDTKNKLVRTANWLAQGMILRKMQEACRYSIRPNLDEGRQNMMPYLKNYAPMPGVFVNGNISNVNFTKIQLTNKAIVAFLKVEGDVKVNVDGLK